MTDNGTPGLRETGSLGSTLRRGAVLSAVALVIVQTVSFLQTLVIARLLSPAEIGIFAAGTVLTSFLITFSEGGLRHALIQHDGDVEEVANTVFWATIVTGALMSALMLAASPFVAMVFDSETAGLIAAITSGTLLLHAFTNVPDSLMQRRFDFRRRLIVDPGVAISFAVTSVVLCSSGYGVWGLVIATYASHVVWIASTWGLARWRPGGARPSYRLWRRLARFALPMVLDGFVERIREVIETVVVGRGLSESALGQYRYGRRMAMLPGVAIVQICSYVLFPAFSRIAGDAGERREQDVRTDLHDRDTGQHRHPAAVAVLPKRALAESAADDHGLDHLANPLHEPVEHHRQREARQPAPQPVAGPSAAGTPAGQAPGGRDPHHMGGVGRDHQTPDAVPGRAQHHRGDREADRDSGVHDQPAAEVEPTLHERVGHVGERVQQQRPRGDRRDEPRSLAVEDHRHERRRGQHQGAHQRTGDDRRPEDRVRDLLDVPVVLD